MRTNPRHRFFLLTAAALLYLASQAEAQQIETHFSPRGDCAAAIVAELNAAKKTVDVALFQLTYEPLVKALADAQARGVTVRLIVDRRLEKTQTDGATFLQSKKIEVRSDKKENLFHNKYAVCDGSVTVTGSFNWTTNAEERNAENLLVIRHHETGTAFAANFNKHWDHSVIYIPKIAA